MSFRNNLRQSLNGEKRVLSRLENLGQRMSSHKDRYINLFFYFASGFDACLVLSGTIGIFQMDHCCLVFSGGCGFSVWGFACLLFLFLPPPIPLVQKGIGSLYSNYIEVSAIQHTSYPTQKDCSFIQIS